MWATGSRNVGTGWRARLTRFWYGLTTETCLISVLLAGSTPARLGGLFFWAGSASPSPIGQAHGTSRRTPCHVSSLHRLRSHPWGPFCHPPVWWEQPGGRLRGWSRRHKRTIQLLRIVHRVGCSFHARSSVLQWGHDAKIACHPGALRTLGLLQQRFWWPSMSSDPRSMSPPAPFAPAVRHPTAPLLAFSALFPFLIGLGLTSPWTL